MERAPKTFSAGPDVFARRQLLVLETGRAVAALLVALFHIEGALRNLVGRYPLDNLFRAGHAGVEYFFVLSGFVMFWVHRQDFTGPPAALSFLKRRAVRILPMYWLAFLCMGVGLLVFPQLLQGRAFSISDITRDFFLLPRDGEMVLNVAWTLRQELIFYIIFGLSLATARFGLAPVMLWQCAIMIFMVDGVSAQGPVSDAVFRNYNLGFGAGILAAAAQPMLQRTKMALPIGVLGLIGFAVLFGAESVYGAALPHVQPAFGETLGPLLYIFFAALLVAGFVSVELRSPPVGAKAATLVTLLGGASYTLYLFHGMFASVLIRMTGRLGSVLQAAPFAGLLILTLSVLALCVALHVIVERPLLRLLAGRRRTEKSAQKRGGVRDGGVTKVVLIAPDIPDYALAFAELAGSGRSEVTLFIGSNRIADRPAGHIAAGYELRAVDWPRQSDVIGNLAFADRIAREVGSLDPDVVHILCEGNVWMGLIAQRLKKYPLLVTVHDVELHPGDVASGRAPRFLVEWLLKQADALLVHGDRLREQAGARRAFAGKALVTFPHPPLYYYKRLADAASPPKARDGKFRILFFGRVCAYKGVDYLLEAMSIVRAQRHDVELTIAGAGPDWVRLKPLVAGRDDIRVIDRFIPAQEAAQLFAEADLLALPYTEASQSGVLMAALPFGLPVVASEVGEIAVTLKQTGAGLLTPPADAQALAACILQLVEQPAERERLVRASRDALAGPLSGATMLAALTKIYLDVVAQKAPEGTNTMVSQTEEAGAIPSEDVLGVPVSCLNLDRAVRTIIDWSKAGASNFVCVRDVHGVMLAQKDAALKDTHKRAGMVVPDGMPLVWILRARGRADVGRVCGYDLVERLCDKGVAEGVRHYFYGGKPGVAERMADALIRKCPGLIVAGTGCPPFRKLSADEDAQEIAAIAAAKPHVVWVGLSTPKQEGWMRDHVGQIAGATLIGVGAAFDFHAGEVARAPSWVQRSGLEWAHRLASDPVRLWRRYLVLAPRFAFLTAIDAVKSTLPGQGKRYSAAQSGRGNGGV